MDRERKDGGAAPDGGGAGRARPARDGAQPAGDRVAPQGAGEPQARTAQGESRAPGAADSGRARGMNPAGEDDKGDAGAGGKGPGGTASGDAAPAGTGAAPADADALMDLYYDVSMEGVDLRRFLERLDAGEWGPVAPDVVVDFLRDLEAVILSNIDVKAMEGPHYAGRRMDVIEETQREFEELIARYLNRM